PKAALGAIFAGALAAEGAKVVLADTKDCASVAAEIAAKGGTAHAVRADMRDEKSVGAMIAEAEKQFGRLAICQLSRRTPAPRRSMTHPNQGRPSLFLVRRPRPLTQIVSKTLHVGRHCPLFYIHSPCNFESIAVYRAQPFNGTGHYGFHAGACRRPP